MSEDQKRVPTPIVTRFPTPERKFNPPPLPISPSSSPIKQPSQNPETEVLVSPREKYQQRHQQQNLLKANGDGSQPNIRKPVFAQLQSQLQTPPTGVLRYSTSNLPDNNNQPTPLPRWSGNVNRGNSDNNLNQRFQQAHLQTHSADYRLLAPEFQRRDVAPVVVDRQRSVTREELLSPRTVPTNLSEEIFCAVKDGNVTELKRLVSNPEAKNVINQVNLKGETPLYIAARAGNVELVLVLITVESIDVNFQVVENGDVFTALHVAAMNEHADVVVVLLACGAMMNLMNAAGFTAKQQAKGYVFLFSFEKSY